MKSGRRLQVEPLTADMDQALVGGDPADAPDDGSYYHCGGAFIATGKVDWL